MNEHEIELFTNELTTAFPGFAEVAERQSPNFKATKRAWAKAWEDLSLSECRDVLKSLLLDGGIKYEEYREPGPFIRRLVMSRRNRGKSSEEERAEVTMKRSTRKDYTGSPMAKALSQAMKAKTEGKSESECLAMIESSFPPAREYDQPRYKCPVCLDRAIVLVWRADFVRSVIQGKLSVDELTRKHTYNVACFCEHGQNRNLPRDDRFKLPTFTTEAFCRFSNLTIEEDRATLREWIAAKNQGAEWNPNQMEFA